jgi:hypothetical protein
MCRANVNHSGQFPYALEGLPVKACDLLVFRVPRIGKIDLHRDDVSRIKTWIDRLQPNEATNHQSGANQQD